MTVEIGLTVLIVAVAAAWTGRRFWRSVRRRGEPTAVCGSVQAGAGGCGSCPLAGAGKPDADQNITCQDPRSGES